MARPVLALDIGGTKMLAALVSGSSVIETHKMPTPRGGDPEQWLIALFDAIAGWKGRYDTVGVAVTGIIDDGCWSALNRKTLDIPDRFPLTATIARLSGCDAVLAANDAQAAAWGEYRFGAGAQQDMVFLTVSTGIGGGIVVNGQLARWAGWSFRPVPQPRRGFRHARGPRLGQLDRRPGRPAPSRRHRARGF